MPLMRDSSGRIVETSESDVDAPTVKGGSPAGAEDFDAPTVIGGSARAGGSSGGSAGFEDLDDLDPATRIATGGATGSAAPKGGMADPLSGWLVVIDGPGRGEFVKLGLGRNQIGRGPDNRASLDFGDSEISRSTHCAITFDGKSGRFYLTHGEGSNLTYLRQGADGDEAPVLQPMEIFADARITLGQTTVRFVPFCDDAFAWSAPD